jgi:hypothetical protein
VQAAETSGIIGGTPVSSITDVPWQVGLIRNAANASTVWDGQFCGGTVINASWVLTAAHCLYDYRSSTLGIFAGDADLGVPVGTDVHTALRWKVHPSYSPNNDLKRDVEFTDLALVKLETPFDFSNPAIQPATLPTAIAGTAAPATGDSIHVSGWGATVEDDFNPNYPDWLQQTDLTVLSNGETSCGNYATADWYPATEICVGVDGGGKDTCWGDSGGPYIDAIDGNGDANVEPTLVGVTSWGEGCAEAAYPGIAARVSAFVDWIVPRSPAFTTVLSTNGLDTVVRWQALSHQLVSYPVSGYRIEYSTDSGATWQLGATVTASARSAVIRGVTGAEFRLAALNAVNVGGGPYLWSGTGDADTARAVAAPGAPLDFALWYSTPKRYVFRLTRPDTVNGSAAWDYRVYRGSTTGVGRIVERVRSLSTIITVSRKHGTGRFWAVAMNNLGESRPSNTVIVR